MDGKIKKKNQGWENVAFLPFAPLHPWFGGGGRGGGLLFHFILSKIAILDKINGKPRPPLPPKSRMGKWRVFALRAASSLIWGVGGLLFHFILFKIVELSTPTESRHATCLLWGKSPSVKLMSGRENKELAKTNLLNMDRMVLSIKEYSRVNIFLLKFAY